jgi:N-6 DNA Methylase
VDARLLRASGIWQEAPEFRGYGHALRRFFVELQMDAVLCVEGRPSVCIKDARELSPTQVEELRRQLWNLGATTLFVAEGQHDIKVFSTLVRPAKDDNDGYKAQLTNETIQHLQTAELALKLRHLIHRVETGAIYREYTSLFDSRYAVDRLLLDNLREARNLICPVKSREGYKQTHALIGRFLFSCYLLDRHIIGPPFLKKANLPEADDMLALLGKVSGDGPKALGTLFRTLQRDFNGSLFGPLLDDQNIEPSAVVYLHRFLSGEDLRTGQLSLFKLYDFGFIPVELISSIYEDFLGAEAEIEKPTQLASSASHSQRIQGAYYTPPRLAELAVDIATEGWSTLLDKRCFDPACGSGVFLVILFIRMAEEWRKRNPDADTRRRYDELMRLLSENLRGGDIHPTACLVTCFSLYLAFLDQMDPKEVVELQEALERDTKEKILPRILWEHGKSRPKQPHFATVRESDFFLLPPEKEFHLVIGNPPWVSRKPAPTAEKWLFSAKDNPYAKGIGNADHGQALFPTRELACAFMWKAGLHLLPEGRVCQVLPSRVFLSSNTDRFQSSWLQHHRLETLWLLADWRFVLFPTAYCPCFVSRYHPRKEGEALGEFEFITPKVELLDPRAALIPVLPEDQKTLSELNITSAAERQEAAAAWKEHHWGTPRDTRLIERLMRLPKLKRLAKRPPRDPDSVFAHRERQWFKGQGFQPATASTTDPEPVFWKNSDLFLSADVPVLDLLLLKENCSRIGTRYKDEGLHRSRSPLIYKHPLLLINKACTKFLFSDFDVLFQDDFQSISAPKAEEDELLFLTAVLSSPLTQYLLFHTTANIGIERDIARLEEILELPFPLPEDMRDPKRSQAILHSSAQRLRKLRNDLQKPGNLLKQPSVVENAQGELYEFICEYFEISDWERYLIKDTVEIFRPSSTPSSFESDKLITAGVSTLAHRKEYAQTLVKTFRGWTRTKRHLWAEGNVANKIGLALITFGVGDKAKSYFEAPLEDRVTQALESIRKTTARNGAVFSRLRGFALYEPDRVHILKPLNRRHWTRTAALNDADEILTRMMEEDGWRD